METWRRMRDAGENDHINVTVANEAAPVPRRSASSALTSYRTPPPANERRDTHTHTHLHCRTHLLYIHTAGRIKHTDARHTHTHTHTDTSLILLIAHVDTGGVQTDSTEIKAASSDHWSCCVVAVLEYVEHEDVLIRIRGEKSNGKLVTMLFNTKKRATSVPAASF